jgi:ABC-type phosphate transport system substrate-binding protein
MRSRTFRSGALVACLLLSATASSLMSGLAGATSPPAGTVYGEGGSAVNPIMSKLLHDDSAGLAPDFGSYTNVDLDAAISDFVGTAPGTFGADFAVTERPLTTAESTQATADGRTFAYVPLAASPDALVALVPSNAYGGGSTITYSQYCQHIPLTLTDLADIFGFDKSDPLNSWGDARIQCSTTPGSTTVAEPITRWANLDPTMENYDLMNLLDSTTASQALFQAGLNAAQSGSYGLTTSTTPSELWPYSKPSIPGGDEALLAKVIAINNTTNAPGTQAAQVQLGSITPVASDWTGSPLGEAWNLPTAAIQNDAGAYLYPSSTSAAASLADATLASTSNPLTNNLVTFNASPTDTEAYNNYLMMESYLVVPTAGLSTDKATVLAQFIRFALGGIGQADITAMGAAPDTPAMVSAGLKVAQELDTEAATASDTDPTSTTTTTAAGSSTTTTTLAAASIGTAGGSGVSTSSDNATSADALAVTGSDPLPLVVVGLTLSAVGEAARRLNRRRRART